MAKKSSGGTPALVALEQAGVAHTVHAYEHDPGADVGYGLEAAQVLGIPAEQVYKTLMADVDGTLTVAVVPVTGKLDLKALAAAVGGKKAAMADPTVAERVTGYVVGGISPLGQKTAHPTVVDETRGAVRHGLRLRRATRHGHRSRTGRPRRADRRDVGRHRQGLTRPTIVGEPRAPGRARMSS